MIYEEISTDAVEERTKDENRIFVRIHAAGEDFSFNKVIGFIKTVEESLTNKNELETIVFSNNNIVHYKIEKNDKMSQHKIVEKILNSLHLDYLPYTDVIASLPKTEENKKLLKEVCARFGIII